MLSQIKTNHENEPYILTIKIMLLPHQYTNLYSRPFCKFLNQSYTIMARVTLIFQRRRSRARRVTRSKFHTEGQ